MPKIFQIGTENCIKWIVWLRCSFVFEYFIAVGSEKVFRQLFYVLSKKKKRELVLKLIISRFEGEPLLANFYKILELACECDVSTCVYFYKTSDIVLGDAFCE